MENLEKRMYGVVMYQLKPIQAGIQFQHAVTRYGRNYPTEEYNDWVDNWQTSIVLNGGTTNTNPDRLGSLNKLYNQLTEAQIICEPFFEPDLGDQMTAFCVLTDARVFDKETYLPFRDWIAPQMRHLGYNSDDIRNEALREETSSWKEDYIKYLGGEDIYLLRNTIGKLPLWT